MELAVATGSGSIGDRAILWVTILASISGMDSKYIAAKHVRSGALVEVCCHRHFGCGPRLANDGVRVLGDGELSVGFFI
jgi:hypothetical protein